MNSTLVIRIKRLILILFPPKQKISVILRLIRVIRVPSFLKMRMLAGCILCILATSSLWAHSVNYALEKEPGHYIAWFYIKLGFQHIIPQGADHILFIIALCLLSTKIKTIIWQATAFTLAHSVTLALSMKNIIVAPSDIVEPIISLTICFVAAENLLITQLKPWRIAIVFLFGLIHGVGFASALNEIGLPPNKFYLSLLSFNLGVELGQVGIIVMMFLILVNPIGNKPWYRQRLVHPLSILIALIAGYWTIQRLLY